MTRTIVLDQFALTVTPPADVWAVVGNVRRLPEWTDADEVRVVEPEPPVSGGTFRTRAGATVLDWRVNNFEPYLFEAVTTVAHGRLGIGVRVLRDPAGARLILAGAYRPASTAARVAFRAAGGRSLRARFDRWSAAALRLAANN